MVLIFSFGMLVSAFLHGVSIGQRTTVQVRDWSLGTNSTTFRSSAVLAGPGDAVFEHFLVGPKEMGTRIISVRSRSTHQCASLPCERALIAKQDPTPKPQTLSSKTIKP